MDAGGAAGSKALQEVLSVLQETSPWYARPDKHCAMDAVASAAVDIASAVISRTGVANILNRHLPKQVMIVASAGK
jgi:hypothetical protein